MASSLWLVGSCFVASLLYSLGLTHGKAKIQPIFSPLLSAIMSFFNLAIFSFVMDLVYFQRSTKVRGKL